MLTIEDLQEGKIMGWEPPFPGVPKYNPATFWGELSAFESTKDSLRGVPAQSNRQRGTKAGYWPLLVLQLC